MAKAMAVQTATANVPSSGKATRMIAARAAIQALRPHARVLLRSEDEDDLPDVLTALRA